MRNDVLVTGFGVHTAFGRGAPAMRRGVFTGTPAFTSATRFDTAPYRTTMAATAPGRPVMRDVLAGCAHDAFEMAGLDTAGDAAVLLGCAGDFTAITRFWRDQPAQEAAEETADSVPVRQVELLAERFGLRGQRLAFTNACVASANAIIHAWRLIASGRAEIAVCAGAYLVEEENFAKFDSGRALARDDAVRPFSADRTGLLLGDGVAVIVLESAERVHRRRAHPLARVAGCGMAADAYHIAKPHPDGAGLAAAIEKALRCAELTPVHVDYVNAHGTGTPFNDSAETRGLHTALRDRAKYIPISSTKSTTGHMLEASGAVEFVITLLALTNGVLPPTAGYTTPDPDCDLDYVPEHPRTANVRRALSLNAAFGGQNTAILLEQI